jgi:Uma2 family endonuclease
MAALPQSALISVEEYLNTQYDPDVEFVDGVLVERNLGDWLHSLVQSNILFAIRLKYPHLKVVPELRSSVTSTRFRLPDVCVLETAPKTRYLLESPLLVVEVLSEGDAVSAVLEKLKEYSAKGVKNIWLIDPRLRLLFRYCDSRLEEIQRDEISTLDGAISISRSDIFAE